MRSIIGEFRIGETIVVALDAVSGDPDDVSAITAAMRLVDTSGEAPAFVAAAEAIALTPAPRAAAGDIPAGWTLTLAAAASAELSPGTYGLDARLSIAGGVDITDETALLVLTEAAVA